MPDHKAEHACQVFCKDRTHLYTDEATQITWCISTGHGWCWGCFSVPSDGKDPNPQVPHMIEDFLSKRGDPVEASVYMHPPFPAKESSIA
jgi:hypothetical protein